MSCYPIDHLNNLYENFPKELRYILDERIQELLNTLPEITVTLKNKRFVLIDMNEDVIPTEKQSYQFNNGEEKDYYNLPPLNLKVVPNVESDNVNADTKFPPLFPLVINKNVNNVDTMSPYVHIEPDYTKNISKQFDVEETNSITHKNSLNK